MDRYSILLGKKPPNDPFLASSSEEYVAYIGRGKTTSIYLEAERMIKYGGNVLLYLSSQKLVSWYRGRFRRLLPEVTIERREERIIGRTFSLVCFDDFMNFDDPSGVIFRIMTRAHALRCVITGDSEDEGFVPRLGCPWKIQYIDLVPESGGSGSGSRLISCG